MGLIKRYTSILLVAAVLFSLFVFPVSASEVDTTNDTGLLHYDLLSATEYYFLPSDNLATEPFYEFYSFNSDTMVGVTWPTSSVRDFDKVIFSLSCSVKPGSVYMSGSEATFLDFIDYSSGNDIYFYSVDYSDNLLVDEVSIRCNFGSVYVGFFGVYSCVGLLDTAQSIDNIDVYREDYFLVTEGYEFTEADPIKNKKLPYTFSKLDEESGYYRSNFRFIVDGDDFVSPLVDNVSLLFTTCCTTISHSVTLISKNSSSSDVNDLKYNLTDFFEWGTSGDYFQGYGEFEAYKTFQIDADLSGFDMSEYDLLVTIGVETITETNGFDACYLDLSLRNISYVPFVENAPWYKSFFGPFFSWIGNSVSIISDWCGSIYYSIVNKFDLLFEKLEEYFGDDGSLAQAGDQMSEQAGQMNDANDSLNSVEKPTLDTGTMFSGLLDFDSGGLTILASMTSNVYVTQLLIVVFTFALCGYVFFGKRR